MEAKRLITGYMESGSYLAAVNSFFFLRMFLHFPAVDPFGVFRWLDPLTVLSGVRLGQFRTEKNDERRIVHPQQKNSQRARGAICGTHAADPQVFPDGDISRYRTEPR